jgi:hypothetical protein
MATLTEAGRKLVQDLSDKYAVSADAIEALAEAVYQGGGAMAQFAHPELGGSGQWMAGGMTMVGDMFNHGLKAKVDGIAQALASAMAGGLQIFERPAPKQTSAQWQGQGGVGMGRSCWWPEELGLPAATGGQNNTRYAYFPQSRRLAVEENGQLSIYDTEEHHIGGFSQQQPGAGSISFTSQRGTIKLSDLKKVGATPEKQPAPAPTSQIGDQPQKDVFAMLERLKAMADKGIITAAEFEAKKKELLSRL